MQPGKPGANKVLGKRKKLRTKITAKVQKIKPRGNKLQQRQEENAAGKKRRLLLALEQQQQQHRAASSSLFHSFEPHCSWYNALRD